MALPPAHLAPLLEQTLVELSQWLARLQQYSAKHPACAQLGSKVHATICRALEVEPTLTFSILADGVMMGELAAVHPAIRTRTAPLLHQRGVLAMRFQYGVTVEELTDLVELCALPVQSIFDQGGMMQLARERRIKHIQIDEIAHDITAGELEAQRRRVRLRAFLADALRNLLARRRFDISRHGDTLRELLDYPDIALTLLEENMAGICVMFAAVCLMVREEERRTGDALYPKLAAIFIQLSPATHDRIVMGCPSLAAELRAPLVWACGGLDEPQLARIVLSAFRSHSTELDVVFYAIAIAAPHQGRRFSMLKRVALHLYDLPSDDPPSVELCAYLARPAEDFDSFHNERDCFTPDAARIMATKDMFVAAPSSTSADAPRQPPFEGRLLLTELIAMAARTRFMEQLCTKLPAVALSLARAGAAESVLGIINGLNASARPDLKELIVTTMRSVASLEVSTEVLADLETGSEHLEGDALEQLTTNVRIFVALQPQAVLDHLEISESRKMRKVLIEALSRAGPKLLPLLKARLESPHWYVVRNIVTIVPRLGGTTADLAIVSRYPHERVRIEVVRALRLLAPDEVAMDIVSRYITDPSPEVRQASRVMLRGEMLSAAAVAALERIVMDETQPEDLRVRIIDALGTCPRDAAATALFALLQPRGLIELSTLRDKAAAALCKSPAPNARQHFAEGLHSSAWRVRKACERAASGGT